MKKKAFGWYLKAAKGDKGDNSNAENNLGDCYKYGIGTIKDEFKVFVNYSKVVKKGNSETENNLGDRCTLFKICKKRKFKCRK
jgi:TPR repeat protein